MGNNGYSKSIIEIGETGWVKYHWIDVTTWEDAERQYIQGLERAPDEVLKAKLEWELWKTLMT